jgi:hypothetical protein
MADQREAREQHRWLKWVGLQEPPVDPEAWMAVVQDLTVDDVETGLCEKAIAVTEALKAAGIEAQQRAYVRADQGRLSGVAWGALVGGAAAGDRVRVAVLVHNRDLEEAKIVVAGLNEPPELEDQLTSEKLTGEGSVARDT